jgi:hypothetical protein
MAGLSIDFETADLITRLNLTEHRDYLQSELDQMYETMDSEHPYWMHPDDIDLNHSMIKRINVLLEYFGGELYGERKAGKFNTTTSMVEASQRLEAYFLEVGKKSAEERNQE